MVTIDSRAAQQREEIVAEQRVPVGERLLLGAVGGVFAGAIFIGLNIW